MALGSRASAVVLNAGALNWNPGSTSGSLMLFDYEYTKGAGDTVVLTYTRNNLTVSQAVTGAGGTKNAVNLVENFIDYDAGKYSASELEVMTSILDEFNAVTNGLARPTAQASNDLTGELNAAGAEASSMTARKIMEMIGSDLSMGSLDASTGQVASVASWGGNASLCDYRLPWRFRLLGSLTHGNMSGVDGYLGYTVKNRVGVLAIERYWNNVTVGVAGGWGYTKMEAKANSGQSTSHDYGVMLYGRYDFDKLFVTGRIGYTRSDIDTRRDIASFGEMARGEFDADYFSAALAVELVFEPGCGWELVPTLG